MPSSFTDLKLDLALLQITQELGFQSMTEIQEKSIPLLLAGRDLIGQSQTGSGKTAAFSLPMLQKILDLKMDLQRERHLQALILCPTRELCAQIARDVRTLGRRIIGLRTLPLAGGQTFGPQSRALEEGIHVVIGTPGRVLDHLNRGTLDLSTLKVLVLDEADRMLEMGFEAEMDAILSHVPETRQTALFSATFPQKIEALSGRYLKNPERVTASSPPETRTIREVFLEIRETSDEAKLKGLLWVLAQFEPVNSILFCNFKASASDLARDLRQWGVDARSLHGDLEQAERDSTLAKFRNGSIRVLVATDVAARGIDIADLDLVVNFELPKQQEIYTHRIGRTGRAGKTGVAVSIAFSRELSKLPGLENLDSEHAHEETTFQELKDELHQRAKMETLFISGGRKNKIRPGDILGALTGDAGLRGESVGKIEIHDFFSYVAVEKSVSREALARLRDGRIKGSRWRVEVAR